MNCQKACVSPDGTKIYMSDPDRKRMDVLNLGDGTVTYFGGPGNDAGQFRGQSGTAIGPQGNIYVLDRMNDNIQVFPPQ